MNWEKIGLLLEIADYLVGHPNLSRIRSAVLAELDKFNAPEEMKTITASNKEKDYEKR